MVRDHSVIILPKRYWLTHGEILPRGCEVRMSLSSRREYLKAMIQRYQTNTSRIEKSQIIDELMEVLGYHRKYAIQILNGPIPVGKPPQKRHKSFLYTDRSPACHSNGMGGLGLPLCGTSPSSYALHRGAFSQSRGTRPFHLSSFPAYSTNEPCDPSQSTDTLALS